MPTIALIALCTSGATAQPRPELPRPTYQNTFYLFMRCYDIPGPTERNPDVGLDEQRAFGQDFLDRLGGHRLYVRLSLRGPRLQPSIKRELGFSDETGDAGYHRFYSRDPQLKAIIDDDRRYLQWFSNGETHTQRETHFGASYACFSRYATQAWDIVKERLRRQAQGFLNQQPSIDSTNASMVVVVTGPGESSLLETGSREGLLADYSPLAVAEFRDWLTHRGMYAEGHPYAGQGRPGGEVYADDPSPAEAAGGNKPFNEAYGTDFATWELLYYDLDGHPDPPSHDAAGMPGPGDAGHTPGGFDAPRQQREGDPLWDAWNNDDPEDPGFRQTMVRNYVADAHQPFADEGVPRDRIFASVIAHDQQQWHIQRKLADADPYWVARNAYGSPGFTMYGPVCRTPQVYEEIVSISEGDPPNWMLGEWHAYSLPPQLYSATVEEHRAALDLMWSYRPHCMEIEGWTGLKFGGNWGYETKNTNFEWALREWLAAMPDQPYGDREVIDYAPPPVREVATEQKGDRLLVSWSPLIWEGLDYDWSDWRDFSRFAVYGSDADEFSAESASLLVQTVADEVSLAGPLAAFSHYHVLAVKTDETPPAGKPLPTPGRGES